MKNNLHHRGLVKLLVVDELHKRNDTWENFLIKNQFGKPQEAEKETELGEIGQNTKSMKRILKKERKILMK
jgi:hypothetical protein